MIVMSLKCNSRLALEPLQNKEAEREASLLVCQEKVWSSLLVLSFLNKRKKKKGKSEFWFVSLFY